MPRVLPYRILFALVVSSLAATIIGCRAVQGPPTPADVQYDGPLVAIDSAGSEHILVAELPSAGYSFTLEQVDERYRERWVFATIRRPNPTILYPQQVVTQRLASGVSTDNALRVYVRLIDFDERNRGPAPRFVGAAEPRPKASSGSLLSKSSRAHAGT